MQQNKRYYVVWAGHSTGVFDSWEECKLQTENFPGARYKSFSSKAQAIEAYRGNPEDYMALYRGIAARKPKNTNYDAIPGIRPGSIAVDAACSRNPGPVEYQGVDITTGTRLFHVGPLADGTNNIGEFLAIVHALAWLDKINRPDIAIYSDSRTAQAWVRNKKAKTTITPTVKNEKIRQLITRAEAWLATHTPKNPIYKWDTDNWGEIPADFGRK